VTAPIATPAALVTAVTVVMPAPLAGPVNVTVTPATGLLLPSFTVATSGLPNAELICALCPPPLVAVIVAAAPAVLVKEYVAGAATPGTVAFTVYGPPAVALAVTAAVATPEALVTAVTVVMLAPLAGPVNVTVTPATGLLLPSFTVATSGLANAAVTCALCPPAL